MWLASIVVHIVVFFVNVMVNFFIFIINMVSQLLGKGAVFAYRKYSDSKYEKRENSAKEKISAVQTELYGVDNSLAEQDKVERNVIVVDKIIKPLSENTTAISMLQDDEVAMELAQDVPIKYVIVELQNKQRLHFAIQDSSVYDLIFVGDIGTLTYQGKRWISYERNKQELQGQSIYNGV